MRNMLDKLVKISPCHMILDPALSLFHNISIIMNAILKSIHNLLSLLQLDDENATGITSHIF